MLGKTTAEIGAAVVVAVSIAAAVGAADGRDPEVAAHHDRTLARTVRSDLTASYRFLTSASATQLPKSLWRDVSGLPGARLDLARGREAGSVHAERLWLVPGGSRSCLELDVGGSACGPSSLIARQGVWLMLVPVSGAAPTVYGIVPDGAFVSGHAATVAQSGNAYMVRPSSRRPGRFTIHTRRGVTAAMTIPAATGHRH